MKRLRLAIWIAFVFCPAALRADYLVRLDPLAAADGAEKVASQLAATYGGSIARQDPKAGTFVLRIPESRARLLAADPHVASIAVVPNAAPSVTEPVNWTAGVSYTYDGSSDVRQIGNDTFAYDYAGRMVQAKINSVQRTFNYDAFGNRTRCDQSGTDCQFGITVSAASAAKNQIQQASYDNSGNVKAFAGHQYSYDALNMPVRDDFGPLAREFVYTADDERLAVYEVGSSWRWTVRNVAGKVLRELTSNGGATAWNWEKDYVWRNGQLLASRQLVQGTPSTYHYHLDHLGTPRRVTDQNDQTVGFHDYFAFGPEVSGGLNEPSATALKYTAHERDTWGSGGLDTLDYMHARYYNPALGRFFSVDPSQRSARGEAPQTWNRYAYVANNPLAFVDPDGRELRAVVDHQKTLAALRLSLPLGLRNRIGSGVNSKGQPIITADNTTRTNDPIFKSIQRVVNSPGVVEIKPTPAGTQFNVQDRNGVQSPVSLAGAGVPAATIPSRGTAASTTENTFSTTPGVTEVRVDSNLSAYDQAPKLAAELGAHAGPALQGQGAPIPNQAQHQATEQPIASEARTNRDQQGPPSPPPPPPPPPIRHPR
jgi:RHS repeat-associated protein